MDLMSEIALMGYMLDNVLAVEKAVRLVVLKVVEKGSLMAASKVGQKDQPMVALMAGN